MLQVRFGKKVVCSLDYSRFLNIWVTANENVIYRVDAEAERSLYRLKMTYSSGQSKILDCEHKQVLWSDDYVHIRPKWGIKRRKFPGMPNMEIHYEYVGVSDA